MTRITLDIPDDLLPEIEEARNDSPIDQWIFQVTETRLQLQRNGIALLEPDEMDDEDPIRVNNDRSVHAPEPTVLAVPARRSSVRMPRCTATALQG